MAGGRVSLGLGKDKAFYVYLYRDPRPRKDNQPIYVGKGLSASDRASAHWIHGARNPFLRAVLTKIRAAGLIPKVEVSGWFDDESEAFALERTLIAQLGRRDLGLGPLLNLTDGGDGASGVVQSEAWRESHRLSAIATWKNASEDKRLRMLTSTVLWEDAEHRAKRQAAMKAARARDWADPEKRAAHIAASMATKKSNASKIGAKTRAYYASASPERLAEHRAKLKSVKQADAEATGIRSKEMWSRPGHREMQSEAIRNGQKSAWSDPVKRAQRLAKLRATREAKRSKPPN